MGPREKERDMQRYDRFTEIAIHGCVYDNAEFKIKRINVYN